MRKVGFGAEEAGLEFKQQRGLDLFLQLFSSCQLYQFAIDGFIFHPLATDDRLIDNQLPCISPRDLINYARLALIKVEPQSAKRIRISFLRMFMKPLNPKLRSKRLLEQALPWLQFIHPCIAELLFLF